ncbi:MAG: hypothetical protein KY476_11620 [Planctomycetes bacterium]|nr:hypothetical protein [Planctomycetota bacterium]
MQRRTLLLTVVLWSLVTCLSANEPVRGAEDGDGERLLKAMRQLADGTIIRQKDSPDSDSFTLVDKPVFRYSDQPRRIVDATLWVWTDGVRPVALQKVEAYVRNGEPAWTICFASFSPELLEVRWPDRTLVCKRPGLVLEPLPDPPALAEGEAARSLQLRRAARRFSSRIVHDPRNDVVEQMRLLPRPIYEYANDEAGLLAGAIFGLASNGTNPDAYLVIEVTRDETGAAAWQYGVVRMTSGGVTVSLDDREVWTSEWLHPSPLPRESWMFFFLPRNVP